MAKLPSLNSATLKIFFGKFLKNLSWMFFAAFLVLLVFEFFEVKSLVKLVLSVSQPPAPFSSQKGVRINFENYNQVVGRIQQADSFVPTGGITKNPFKEPSSSSAAAPGVSPSGSAPPPAGSGGLKADDSGGVLKLN